MKHPGKYQNIHQDLIDECLKGSRRAQFKIYRLYYKAMYNTSFRIVNHREEAEDIMQESFLKAFNNLGDYRGNVSFGAWLKKIVVNKSIDAIRKQRESFGDIQKIEETVPDIQDDEPPEIEKLSPEVIIREIELLPAGYRIVLSLYLIEGYSHEEIGKTLNISPSTSRSQFIRGKNKLLNNLKKKYL